MNNEIDDGGPAFPGEQSQNIDGNWNGTFEPGMTLRDYFAARALRPLLADYFEDTAAKRAYRAADAMLEARKMKTP